MKGELALFVGARLRRDGGAVLTTPCLLGLSRRRRAGAVARAWRRVVGGSRQLWRTIHYDDEELSRNEEEHLHLYVAVLRQRCALAQAAELHLRPPAALPWLLSGFSPSRLASLALHCERNALGGHSKALAHFSALRKLRLEDVAVADLAALPPLPALRSLAVVLPGRVVALPAWGLACLRQLPRLEALELRPLYNSHDRLQLPPAAWADLAAVTTLRRLVLSVDVDSDAAAAGLGRLAALALTHVDLCLRCRLPDEALQLGGLVALTLRQDGFVPPSSRALARSRKLTRLLIQTNGRPHLPLLSGSELPPWTNLQRLGIEDDYVVEEDIEEYGYEYDIHPDAWQVVLACLARHPGYCNSAAGTHAHAPASATPAA